MIARGAACMAVVEESCVFEGQGSSRIIRVGHCSGCDVAAAIIAVQRTAFVSSSRAEQ
jgi:hypothetical protein